MSLMILGLLLFLAPHSVHIFAPGWRAACIARIGENSWKLGYSVPSAVGLALIVWGYGLSRADPVFVWFPPVWTRHLATLLMIPSFILLAAAYVPGNRIRGTLGHPMVLGVMVWAFAHLLANGRLSELILFGAFLVWAVLSFRTARRREPVPGDEGLMGDIAVVGAGFVAWIVFGAFLHRVLIGVPAFG